MKFKYNGRIYNPSNIDKKLKKMGITINDIEIINEEKKLEEDNIEESNLKKFIVLSTLDNLQRICYSNIENPSIEDLFKNQIWDSETKTGLYTKEQLDTFYITKN